MVKEYEGFQTPLDYFMQEHWFMLLPVGAYIKWKSPVIAFTKWLSVIRIVLALGGFINKAVTLPPPLLQFPLWLLLAALMVLLLEWSLFVDASLLLSSHLAAFFLKHKFIEHQSAHVMGG